MGYSWGRLLPPEVNTVSEISRNGPCVSPAPEMKAASSAQRQWYYHICAQTWWNGKAWNALEWKLKAEVLFIMGVSHNNRWYYQISPLEKAHFSPVLQIPDGLCVDVWVWLNPMSGGQHCHSFSILQLFCFLTSGRGAVSLFPVVTCVHFTHNTAATKTSFSSTLVYSLNSTSGGSVCHN